MLLCSVLRGRHCCALLLRLAGRCAELVLLLLLLLAWSRCAVCPTAVLCELGKQA
jgi:hypothetical protein